MSDLLSSEQGEQSSQQQQAYEDDYESINDLIPPPTIEEVKRMSWIEGMRERQYKFLGMYSRYGTLHEAAKQAEVSISAHYKWLRIDPAYVTAYTAIKERVGDILESEAFRRAVHGVQRERPIIHRGEVVAYEEWTEYSDTLLLAMLKAHKPKQYREHVTIDIEPMVRTLANEAGLDPDDAVREVQKLLSR